MSYSTMADDHNLILMMLLTLAPSFLFLYHFDRSFFFLLLLSIVHATLLNYKLLRKMFAFTHFLFCH